MSVSKPKRIQGERASSPKIIIRPRFNIKNKKNYKWSKNLNYIYKKNHFK